MNNSKMAVDLGHACVRYTNVRALTPVSSDMASGKKIRVLVTELNPPICKMMRQLAPGGPPGSVPISMAHPETVRKVCPPRPCDCKPLPPPPTERQRLIQRALLAAKILLLLAIFKYTLDLGIWGTSEEVDDLITCWRGTYRDCNDIPQDTIYASEYSPQSAWNLWVLNFFQLMVWLHKNTWEQVRNLLNPETEPKQKPKPPQEKEKKKKKKKEESVFDKVIKEGVKCPTLVFPGSGDDDE